MKNALSIKFHNKSWKAVKRHVTQLQNVLSIEFQNKSWAAIGCQMILGGSQQCRGPPKDHLAAFGCPGFAVKFNTYNIMDMSFVSLTTLLKEGPQVMASLAWIII